MRICRFATAAQVGRAAAAIIAAQLLRKPDSVLGLATGSTPVPTYDELVRLHQDGVADFSRAVSFNLDEYVGIPVDHPCSYHRFMDENLFDRVNMRREAIHVPDGLAPDLAAAAASYDAAIDAGGGIDLQILGIGQNGHIGFNEPDAELIAGTHLADLTEDTIKVNSRFFASIDEVPKQAFSMGIGSIFCARNIIIMASGANKHNAIAKMLEGKLTTMCPATLLNLHPNVTVICDEAAYNG